MIINLVNQIRNNNDILSGFFQEEKEKGETKIEKYLCFLRRIVGVML